MVLHLSLHMNAFGGRSAHLAYHMRKSGRKTATDMLLDTRMRFFADYYRWV